MPAGAYYSGQLHVAAAAETDPAPGTFSSSAICDLSFHRKKL